MTGENLSIKAGLNDHIKQTIKQLIILALIASKAKLI